MMNERAYVAAADAFNAEMVRITGKTSVVEMRAIIAAVGAALKVVGPVYRKVPSNATDADHVCGDEECYRLVEVGKKPATNKETKT